MDTSTSVTFDRFLSVLRTEGSRIAAMPVDALNAPVPSCPGWTLEQVVRHVGKVQLWVAAALRADPHAEISQIRTDRGMPRGRACLVEYSAVLDELLAEFARVDPGRPVPTIGGSGTAASWARRQAHEATVHRFDAADAVRGVGGSAPEDADTEVAADGVDEWARLMLPRALESRGTPVALRGQSVHLQCTDTADAEWLLEFSDESVAVTRGHAKDVAALSGPAQDVLLVLWRRRPFELLQVNGDDSLVQDLLGAVRV